MLTYLEERGAIVLRRDLRGVPIISALDAGTRPGEPELGAGLRMRR
jgi:hypothetical protein